MEQDHRINWISILRGMTITLVVMNHVRLLDVSTGECYSFIFTINELFAPLRMPMFVSVSGILLFYSRINRGWCTMALYRDKIIRLGLPLVFCTVLGNLMQILFNTVVKHPHEVTLISFLKSFLLTDNQPWPHRWYLMTLTLIMTLYPLFKMQKPKVIECIILFILFSLIHVDLGQWGGQNWFGILGLNQYLPYFYLGVVAFRYQWYKYLASWKVSVATTSAYILLYIFHVVDLPDIILHNIPVYEFLGMAMLVSVSMQIDKIYPRFLSSYSGYIFQIYLFGIAFQAFVELILWRAIGSPDILAVPFYFLNVAAGIAFPVILSKAIKRVPYRYLRLCFGLK